MTSGNKIISIRCDMHPPMSASMYCDHCKKFLCKICAEVKSGGRVCASCKKPCRQPEADEWVALTTARARAKEDAKLAKEAEGRIKDQVERAKQERDAKLKAEFAAKKQEWAQREAAKKAQEQQAGAGMALVSGETAPTSGTMYQPNAAPQVPTDPLYKLGERGHLTTINRARNWILAVAILIMLTNGVMYYLMGMTESIADSAHEAALRRREERSREPKKKSTAFIKANPSAEELTRAAIDRAERAEDEASMDAFSDIVYEKAKSGLFWVKLIFFLYFVVGAAFFVLYFQCVTYPKEATQIAFWLYLGVNVVDLILTLTMGRINLCGMFVRYAILAALFKAMQSGQMLHDFRVKNGDIPA